MKFVKWYLNHIEHYNPKKYWARRSYIFSNVKKHTFIKIIYLRYIKKCEAFNCASISLNFNSGCYFKSQPVLPHGIKGIIIGNNVEIGHNCCILHGVTIAEGTEEKPTIVGDNVFIGAGVVIRSGKKIGDNVKIGANAVVTHDIPSNCVVGGVPAMKLK